MTPEAFSSFFHDVFETLIPAEAREAICAYWKAFGVAPDLLLSDAQIDEEIGLGAVDVAVVFGGGCLHRFGFREFVVEHAPEAVARSIIQHELIHCYLNKNKTPVSQLFDKISRDWHLTPIMSPITRLIRDAEEKIRRIAIYNADEKAVAMINTAWGGSDKDAREWVGGHRAQNANSYGATRI